MPAKLKLDFHPILTSASQIRYSLRRNADKKITISPNINVRLIHGEGRFWKRSKTGYGNVRTMPSVKIRKTIKSLMPRTRI
jgi:hypothetical protein